MAIAHDHHDHDHHGHHEHRENVQRKAVTKAAFRWLFVRLVLALGLCGICALGTLTFQVWYLAILQQLAAIRRRDLYKLYHVVMAYTMGFQRAPADN